MSKVLELRGITKAFPGVLANDHIDLTLEKGEIHALLGENGAGKTTLMNILYGLYKPDSGEILVNEVPASIHSPNDAIAKGIGMVHQHFMLVPVMTVAENVMLGVEPTLGGAFLDKKLVAERVRSLSQKYGLDVDPDAYISDLSVGIQQRVEIIKVLYRSADILILDEPTAVLTPQEVEGLFRILHTLVEAGKSIIFITHKLKEVLLVANRITVLRQGRSVGTTTPAETSPQKLAAMMVGREVNLTVQKKVAKRGEVGLTVRNLFVRDSRGELAVQGVDFDVRKGEVLGVAGVQGNGQTELVHALTGLLPFAGGSVELLGKTYHKLNPRMVMERGTAHVPEDRQKHGLILSLPIYENLILCDYYRAPYAHGIALQQDFILDHSKELAVEFDIRTPSVLLNVSGLSGGNQQKVIVAREFWRSIELLIASQPTRGLDVGSIEYIHKRIIEKRDGGTAVLLVSSELDEILALSDRIAVMYRGRIMEIVDAGKVSREYLGLLMAGINPVDAAKAAQRSSATAEAERVF